MDLIRIYLKIRPEDIAYVKFIIESYEAVGIIRTVDQVKAVIVLLAVSDFRDTVRSILDSLSREVALSQIPPPRDLGDDWLLQEMATENDLN